MTSQRDIERALDAWLVEGPTEINDRVVESALDQIEHTEQRRVLHMPRWRDLVMNSPFRLVGAALVAVILVGGVLVLRSSPANVGTNPTPSPIQTAGAPTGTPSTAPSIATAPSCNPFPGATSLVALGKTTPTASGATYATDLSPCGFTVKPGAGWFADHDQLTIVSIQSGPGSPTNKPVYLVQFLVPDKVVQVGTAGPTTAPTDLIAWLKARPDLDLSAPASVAIGTTGTTGTNGTMVEGTVRAGAALNPEGGINLICANVSTCGYEGGELISISPRAHEMFVALDVGGTPVVIALVGPVANTAADRAKLDAVLASVAFPQ